MKLFPVTCEYISGEKQFYYRAQRFYEDVPASEEGMMGDFVDISNVDLEGSRHFLKRFVVSILGGCAQAGDPFQMLQIEKVNFAASQRNVRVILDQERSPQGPWWGRGLHGQGTR